MNQSLNKLICISSSVNIIFHWSNKPTNGEIYITNSIYIPSNCTLNVQSARFLGSSGNFASEIEISQTFCFLYFYSGNSNFAGLDMSIEAYIILNKS